MRRLSIGAEVGGGVGGWVILLASVTVSRALSRNADTCHTRPKGLERFASGLFQFGFLIRFHCCLLGVLLQCLFIF